MIPAAPALTDADRSELDLRGIDVTEVERQWRLLTTPRPALAIDRPCTAGDGIRIVNEAEQQRLATSGRAGLCDHSCARFVPASGAATRMFQDLLAWRSAHGVFDEDTLTRAAASGDAVAVSVLRTFHQVRDFAWFDALREKMAFQGNGVPPDFAAADAALAGPDFSAVAAALLDRTGLNASALPKALLLFHRDAVGRARTALEEHLHEAAAILGDASPEGGLVHFTVSAEHARLFHDTVDRIDTFWERRQGHGFKVDFSLQDPSTDTICVREDGSLARDSDGALLLRPAGHGALLGNLANLDAELITVRNIDNIDPEERRAARLHWMWILAGVALEAKTAAVEALRSLDAGTIDSESVALGTLQGQFGVDLTPILSGRAADERRSLLRQRLARPLRVCAMVRNTGEPGGGPFWVRGGDGVITRQIVEAAQVSQDLAGRALLERATHFNPVDMVCVPRGPSVSPLSALPVPEVRSMLATFVDHDAVIVSRKTVDGVKLRTLERPGLWNGSMAGWNTIFLEVPVAIFNPVKTLNDLLRPGHQPVRRVS